MVAILLTIIFDIEHAELDCFAASFLQFFARTQVYVVILDFE